MGGSKENPNHLPSFSFIFVPTASLPICSGWLAVSDERRESGPLLRSWEGMLTCQCTLWCSRQTRGAPTMRLPASYLNPAPVFFPLNLNDCICASVCVGPLVRALDPLWLCFYFHSLTCGKGSCYIVGFGCSLLKICASPWGVHALSWTGGTPFVCSQWR